MMAFTQTTIRIWHRYDISIDYDSDSIRVRKNKCQIENLLFACTDNRLHRTPVTGEGRVQLPVQALS